MNIALESIIFVWKRNQAYGEKLIADLNDEQMILMPAPKMNHPAWIFSHLGAYYPIIVAIINGEPYEDPKLHKFGMQSQPETDGALYGTAQEIRDAFRKGHEQVADALASANAEILQAPITLERWCNAMGKNGIILNYLIGLHENIHLGQLSAWRRLQGLPSV